MQRQDDKFPLALMGAALLLSAVFKSIIEDAIKAWGAKHFSSIFGDEMTTTFATRMVEMVPAFVLAGLIVWWLYRYIDRQYATPRLQCVFDSEDTGCVRRNTAIYSLQGVIATADWYRLRVEPTTVHAVTGCHGRLTEILRGDSQIMSGEQLVLPFAPSEAHDSMSKTVYPGHREDLDFLIIPATGVPSIPSHLHQLRSGSIDWDGMFRQPGQYTIRIVVVSDNSASVPVALTLDWTGARATSTVSQIS